MGTRYAVVASVVMAASIGALSACGDSTTASLTVAASHCELSSGPKDGVLTVASSAGASSMDVDCLLRELMDTGSVSYFYGPGANVPRVGDRELRGGVWAAWAYNDSGTGFVWKFAGSRSAAIS